MPRRTVNKMNDTKEYAKVSIPAPIPNNNKPILYKNGINLGTLCPIAPKSRRPQKSVQPRTITVIYTCVELRPASCIRSGRNVAGTNSPK